MAAELLVVVLLLLGVAVLLYQGLAILFAYQMPRLDPADPTVRPTGSFAIVIPARDEVDEIAGTLASLRDQDLPLTDVVVVDGGSTDGTREEVARRAPPVRLIDEPPLPPGWIGKSWACWTGARATHGDWLIFLDADVRLEPAAVRTALAWAERERADLASVATRMEMGSRWERIVIPFYVQMVLTHFRAPRVNRPGARAAMANGQFLLVRRSAYDALGGHEAIREQVVEDVALAERFRAAGRRRRLTWGPRLAGTRMYRDRRSMAEGLLKTMHGTSYSRARQVGRLVGLVGLFWLPLGLVPLGAALGSLPLVAMGSVLWVALFGKHAAFARATGAGAADGLLYPVAVGFYAALLLRSIARGRPGGSVRWKGREYRLRPDEDAAAKR